MRMRRLDSALASWNESAAVFAEVLGPNGYEVALVEVNIANGLIELGRPLDAEAPARRARDIAAVTAPKSLIYAEAQIALGAALAERRAWPEAKEALTIGLAGMEATSGDPGWTARGRFARARGLAREGDR